MLTPLVTGWCKCELYVHTKQGSEIWSQMFTGNTRRHMFQQDDNNLLPFLQEVGGMGLRKHTQECNP